MYLFFLSLFYLVLFYLTVWHFTRIESYEQGFTDITPFVEKGIVNAIPRNQPVCMKNVRNVFRYTNKNEVQCLTDKRKPNVCIDTIDFEECKTAGRPHPHVWLTCNEDSYQNTSHPCAIARNQFLHIYRDPVKRPVVQTRTIQLNPSSTSTTNKKVVRRRK